MKLAVFLLGFLGTTAAFGYDGQPKKLKILLHMGKVAVATLDEIRLDALVHTPPHSPDELESYKTREGQDLFFVVDEVKYRLVEMTRKGKEILFKLDFKEVETGAGLYLQDNKEVVNINFFSSFQAAKVLESY
jgi:hypothetical protein